jgi:hypothetical protein
METPRYGAVLFAPDRTERLRFQTNDPDIFQRFFSVVETVMRSGDSLEILGGDLFGAAPQGSA